ncbi:hypothetical protein IQ276_034265 [Desmonostoc muscorum LEGE 12446]|uniref:Uncharacterized protein n=1 Tax=Desmonostoc muscorum LEGE 12446 TaxID=1828758 RepID=A0A8J6ZTF1_DESMC|nr:hypothetical protein [Desmonostoc muscorum]MCF2151393.1 hypothetical protein [Desmonostoc muscorum LEGE 12446]
MITPVNSTIVTENTAAEETSNPVINNSSTETQFEVKEQSDVELEGILVTEFEQEPLTDINFGF